MSKKNIIILISCLLILGIAALVLIYIFSTEPEAQSEGATKKTAMLVSVMDVEKGSFTPEFTATGTVRPVEDLQLSPMVSGQITYRAPAFVPGGIVRKGQQLLKIQAADFENQVKLRESELKQARTNLELEMGRQRIAQQDLALVGADSLTNEQQNLVLRQPQLNAVKAQIQLAEANLEQARLNLQRTSITAPFDAQIVTQNVTVGSQVSPQVNLGRLVGINEYWVEATVPIEKLKWLVIPSSANGKGSAVRIRNKGSWAEGEFRNGYIAKQIGALEQQTRLARILIKIPDPLAFWASNQGLPKLLIDEFVEVQIQGRSTENLIKINRDYLRNNNTVWVMENEELSIRDVTIELIDAEYVYISKGLNETDKIVTTNIATVTEGVALRTEADTLNSNADSVNQEQIEKEIKNNN